MLLSIIIPVYNAEKFIERCILSILAQIREEHLIEIVIINDGSSDKTVQILKEKFEKNSIINIYSQENAGEGHARNKGLEKAKGDFIWFIDADDYIDGTILQTIYTTLTDQNPEVILFGYKTVDLDGNKVSEEKYEDAVQNRDSLLNNSIFSNTVWSKVINKNLIHSNELYFDANVKTATDFHFSFRVLYFSNKVVTLSDVSYNYVVNPESISNIRTKNHLERLASDSVIVAENIANFLESNANKYPKRKNIFMPWLNNYLFGLLFSLIRFDYDVNFIIKIINSLEANKNYPIGLFHKDFKKKLFMFFANNRTLFITACRLKRRFK